MNKFNIYPSRLASPKFILAAFILFFLAAAAFWLLPAGDKALKTHNQITELAQNIRTHYKVRPDYWGLNNDSAIKNKLIPEPLRRGSKILSAVGRLIIVGQDPEGNVVMPGNRSFTLTIADLNKKNCVALAAAPFSADQHLGLLKISVNQGDEVYDFEWGGQHSLPISPESAEKACGHKNSISWTFE